MGLLDLMNDDGARLGLSLLAAAGPSATPMSFGQRLSGAMNNFQAQKDAEEERKLKREAMRVGMEEKAAERQRKDARDALVQQLLGGGLLGAPSNAAGPVETAPSGAQTFAVQPQGAEPQQTAQSRIAGLSADQIAALKANGVDLTELWKTTRPNWQNINGNLVDTNAPGFRGGFQPGVHVSANGQAALMEPDGQGGIRVRSPQGAVDTFGQYQDAQERAKAKYQLVPTDRLDAATGRPFSGSMLDFLQAGQRPPQQPDPAQAGQGGPFRGNFQGDPANVLKAINLITDPVERENALQAFKQQFGNLTPAVGTGQATPAGGRPTLMSPAEAKAQEARALQPIQAGNDINQSWIKSTFEPTVASAAAAQQQLDSITSARRSLGNLGNTGWGTETKAQAANVLAGLGIAPANVKMFAANVQTFQQAAMERLAAETMAQKGPQTEGDAKRLSDTFAKLANTPQANQFILDYMQAKAERDKVKASFYQNALPVARDKGDLTLVDREWLKRAPSLWKMPSLQQYGVAE